jgi:hypothetical protein
MDSHSDLIIKWVVRSGFIILSVLPPVWSLAQNLPDEVSVQGNIYSNAMYYMKDSLSESSDFSEKLRSNTYGNLSVRFRHFSAGIRYEAYLPPLLGYDNMYEGQGISYRFASWENSFSSATIGSFYEQFGSGLILRAYEDKDLGIDNSLDGIKLQFKPLKGIIVKGLIGKQRYYWGKSPGIVRGADGEFNFSELFERNIRTSIIAGGGFVSKYETDNDPIYKLPENVAAFAGRISLLSGPLFFSAEYGWKINDPSAANNMIYKNGQAFLFSSSYSEKGFGLQISGKWIDNMDFRSGRGAVSNALTLSYIPVSFTQKTYSLPAMYPYPSQPLGEAAIQIQLNRKIPKGSFLGGKYGTSVLLIAALANEIKKLPVDDETPVGTPGTKGYSSALFSIGKEKYYRDYSLEINKKLTGKLKIITGISHIFYNKTIIEGHPGEDDVKAWILWCDLSFKLSDRKNLRFEAQNLNTHQDKGSWAMMLTEYTISPNWSFSLTEQYNYGNKTINNRIHYPSLDLAFMFGSQRITLCAGRQRAGILCIGGVCRYVPSTKGIGLTYSITF